jgi:hypothetical protein
LRLDQTKVTTAAVRIALALSVMLFLPAAYAVSSATPLTSPNTELFGHFGTSVSISGGTVVVGAPLETQGTTTFAGHAYVFDATTGGLISTLTSPNPQLNGYFGASVSISGDAVVVGAPDEMVGTTASAGQAYVFDATTGDLITTLITPAPQSGGAFGVSVAIDGSTAVVGAYGETGGTTAYAGQAYVFNATTGELISTLTSPNPQGGGVFGDSVAISDTTVAVGAYGEIVSTTVNAGHAYVFDAMTGSLISTLTSPNPHLYGYFGFSVGVFVDDATVVVGAPQELVGTTVEAGRAYVFDATTGGLIRTLTNPNSLESGHFGMSVAITDTTVVVGAPFETVGTAGYAGRAYVFDATTGSLINTLTSPTPMFGGDFGWSVAISGTTVAVGAPFETEGTAIEAGHAYIFP